MTGDHEDALRPSERILLGALAAFVAAVGVIGIQRPLFIDEAYSVITSSGGVSSVVDGAIHADLSPPLYYLLLHFWIGVAGISEIAVRAPSVLFFVVSVAVAYAIGRETGSRRGGLYAAVFYASSLQAIHLAQKVRGYSLIGLLAALSTLYFMRAFTDRPSSPLDTAAFVAANVAASFTHVWFVFLLAAEAICGLAFWRRSAPKLIVALAASVVPFAVFWVPTLLSQLGNAAGDWIPPVTPASGPGMLLEFYGGWPIGAVVLAAFALVAFAADPARAASGRQWLAPMVVLFAVTVSVPLIVSVRKPVYWPGRYTIIALPALAAALSLALTARARRDVLAVFAVVLMAVALAIHVSTRDYTIENSNAMLRFDDSDQRAAAELLQRVQPGDVVIFTGLTRASIEYYLRRADRDRDIALVSYPAVNATHLGWDDIHIPTEVLQAEAAAVLARVDDARRARKRIWVFPGRNEAANRILAAQLNARLGSPEAFNWRGAFFSGVVAYPRAGARN